MLEELNRTCEIGVDLVVRLSGRSGCFTPSSQTRNVTKEQAEQQGLVVVDDIAMLSCVRTSERFPADRCYTESCPECPSDCCLLNYFRHVCPDIAVKVINNGVPDPKQNRCCNYGREAEAIWTYSTRTTEELYTSFTRGEGGTDGCAPGCYDELMTFRRRAQTYRRYANRFRACDADGTIPDIAVDCISGEFYNLIETTNRIRNNPDNCLSYVDDVNVQESRNSDCWTDIAAGYPLSPLFPRRACRSLIRNYDDSLFILIQEDCGEVGSTVTPFTVCDDLASVRSVQRQLLDRNAYSEMEYLTTFRYGVDCFQGRYLFDQMVTTRFYGLGCPRDGALIARSHTVTEASYSIRTTARDNCDPRSCDGFRRTDRNVTLPGLPVPQPIVGALEFL